jgi:hypothetical protein
LEFKEAYRSEEKEKLWLMAWSSPDDDSSAPPPGRSWSDGRVAKPVADMISEIIDEKEFRVKTPLNTQWLLDSLQGLMPGVKQDIPEATQFPVAADLRKNKDTWKIFDALFSAARRWPSGQNSTVGVPYGTGEDRSTIHNNSLYRIRTTKAYYTLESNKKEENLPTDKVELELWEDAYGAVKEELMDWLRRRDIDSGEAIKLGKHLDSEDKVDVILLRIDKSVSLSEEDVLNFNSILRFGFDKIRRGSAK